MATKKKVKAEALVNKYVFVMDASGSMHGLRQQAIKLINSNIDHLKAEFYRSEQETEVSVIIFNHYHNIKYVYENVHIAKARKISDKDYAPTGATALFDATGVGINDFLSDKDFHKPNVSYVVVAYTDGEENDSKSYPKSQPYKFQDLISRAQNTKKFTVTFQVPHGEKEALVRLGVSRDNIREWEATDAGIKEAQEATRKAITSYTNSRSMGFASVENFYVETDLSKLKTNTLKRELDDISSEFGIFVAKNEGQIRDFVEEKTKETYSKGCAYYQLMKRELVQADKEILIFDKSKTALYGGDEARALVGLPVGANAKVTPGDHANFEIFVQSTSVNRKLMVGQKVAVKVT